MQNYMPAAKLAGKLNRRVMPEFVTMMDEPTRESWEGMKLAGYKLVDDEGMPTEDVTLVGDSLMTSRRSWQWGPDHKTRTSSTGW